MQGIALPELAAGRGLPASSLGTLELEARAGKPFVLQKPSDGREMATAALEDACTDELTRDESGGATRVLPLHGDDELLRIG